MRSHTFVIEDWHMASLERRAKRERRSVSSVVRLIFDAVLHDGIELPDNESLDSDTSGEEGAEE